MTEIIDPAAGGAVSRDFSVQYQKVFMDVDFRRRAISGKTEILILPESKELRTIRLNCRQVKITRVSIEGKTVSSKDIKYTDPYECAKPYPSFTVHQHHLLRNRIRPYMEPPTAQELHIALPPGVRVTNSPPLTLKLFKTAEQEPSEAAANDGLGEFTPLTIEIEFEAHAVRDGLHFVGLEDGDTRYPHMWTNNSPNAGNACSLFPCVDETTSRHPWDITIRCPRTLGDAFTTTMSSDAKKSSGSTDVVQTKLDDGPDDESLTSVGLSERERALDLLVVCSGNLTDEVRCSLERAFLRLTPLDCRPQRRNPQDSVFFYTLISFSQPDRIRHWSFRGRGSLRLPRDRRGRETGYSGSENTCLLPARSCSRSTKHLHATGQGELAILMKPTTLCSFLLRPSTSSP